VRADEKLTAFLEVESAIRGRADIAIMFLKCLRLCVSIDLRQLSSCSEFFHSVYFCFSEPLMRQQKHLGLLILRAAGFLLAFSFGIQKIGWYVTALRTGKHLWSIGLAPLISQIGFPVSISVVLAIWVTFNESIGAFLIGCGLFTRVLAGSAALGMAGALYTSVRLGEDWLRAALYLIIFIALMFTVLANFPWIICSNAKIHRRQFDCCIECAA